MKYIKKSFSLIEMIISMVLGALVLSGLFSLLHYHFAVNAKLEEMKNSAEQMRLGTARLQTIFSNLIFDTFDAAPRHFFYTKPCAQRDAFQLIFTFKNGVDREEEFSSDIVGSLYFDPIEHTIVFLAWPHPAKFAPIPPVMMRKEILLENVTHATLSFWTPDKYEHIQTMPAKTWITEWDKEVKSLPILVRLQVTFTNQPDTPISFAFIIPKTIRSVEYS